MDRFEGRVLPITGAEDIAASAQTRHEVSRMPAAAEKGGLS